MAEGTSITIQRGPNGFGFNLSRIGSHHVFRFVDEAGPAFQAGARVGDSIIRVNGADATILAHSDVAKMIGASPGGVVTMVITPLPLELLEQAANKVTASTAAPTSGNAIVQGNEPRLRITIPKGSDGLGFNLARVNDQHVFRLVDAGGPAFRAGAREGYCIATVNDVSVASLPHKDVVDLIRKATNSVIMEITPPPLEHPTVAAAQQRAVQAEDATRQLEKARIDVEKHAVNMEQHKLSKEQEALRTEQQRVEAERRKLLEEQENLRQQQERMRQERRQVDRSQGLVEEARAAAAAAHAGKLQAEEQVRKLVEEERNLREYQQEVERLRNMMQEGKSMLAAKQRESERLLGEVKKVAGQKELRDCLEIVHLVETKAKDDLVSRQGPLPDNDRERLLEERRREVEALSLQVQVENAHQQELSRLLDVCHERKKEHEKREEQNREKMVAAHFKDAQMLREKQQRIQQLMDEATEEKRRQEEQAAAQRKMESEIRKREGMDRMNQLREQQLAEEVRKRDEQAAEAQRKKLEEEARFVLQQQEQEQQRLQQQRMGTFAYMESQRKNLAVPVNASAPPVERKVHPMVAQAGHVKLAQGGGGLLRFEKAAPNTSL